jgi:hypothetical protein
MNVTEESISATPNPLNEGALVHLSGDVKAIGEPKDEVFGISAPALRIERAVEMYQWVEVKSAETDKKVGGATETTTTYTYEQRWEKGVNNSAAFKQPTGHTNPAFPLDSKTFAATKGTLGGFALTQDQLGKFGSDEPLPVPPVHLAAAQAQFPGKSVTIDSGNIHVGMPTTPMVGDLRISFRQSLPGMYSVVARQVGSGLTDYQTDNGRNLFLVQNSQVPAQAMFATAQQTNKIITWILRGLGSLALFIGFSLILSLMGVLGDIVPFLGRLARFGTTALAFAAAAIVGSLTIAISWFAFRPLLSLGLLVGAALVAGAALFFRRKSTTASQPAATKLA